MTRSVDPVAYEIAMKQYVVPPSLHFPIVAIDEVAITEHIGEVVRVISPGRALLVKIDPPVERDSRLPIFQHQNIERLFEPMTLWVNPNYTRYRKAWVKSFGSAGIENLVIHHIYNRRMAKLRGFGYIRLIPISRSTNSSSAFTEQWGVDYLTPQIIAKRNASGIRMQFADLGDILTMLDIPLGGGVQEVFRIGQNLIEVPGIRPPQT
jgi:hypothetical protein